MVKPSAGSRSLTALSILEHLPCHCAAVAPVLRYAKEIRLAATRQREYSLGFGAQRAAREAAFLGPALPWKKVPGPVTAAGASLDRVGWSMGSFTNVIAHQKVGLCSTTTSPRMLKRFLREGVSRHLHWQSGQSLGLTHRAGVGVVCQGNEIEKAGSFRKGVRSFSCTWRALDRHAGR